MANYSIWILEESNLSVSGGVTLDGITQGDGSHLVGETITLNSADWLEVDISDVGSDTRFDDNDGNQRLDGAQTIDGVTYSSGTVIEAEYRIIVQDSVGNSYEILACLWHGGGYRLRRPAPGLAPRRGTVDGPWGHRGAGKFGPGAD